LTLTLSFWLCFTAISALAQTAAPSISPCTTCRSAPAPLIGLGISAALAGGGVLFWAKLFKRRRWLNFRRLQTLRSKAEDIGTPPGIGVTLGSLGGLLAVCRCSATSKWQRGTHSVRPKTANPANLCIAPEQRDGQPASG